MIIKLFLKSTDFLLMCLFFYIQVCFLFSLLFHVFWVDLVGGWGREDLGGVKGAETIIRMHFQ